MSGPIVDPEDGVFIFNEGITRQWWAYSLETGQQLWGPTAPEQQMNYYGMNSNFYQGKLLTYGYGGVLMAYDIKTGNVLWNYTAAQVGFESPYGNYPTGITAIADGKIYLITGEHSVTQPMWRGFLRCVNASDGAELWKILHFGADGGASLGGQYVVMADGYVVGLDQYDSKIYCYGKGPSAVTVTIQDDVVTDGDSVLVKGTVTDEAPGAKKFAETLGFVNGIPAISDEDQEAWMEYLYKQQVMPTNAKGVEVTLDTLDPNGNFVHIGTVTSDLTGTFGYAFTPEVPGTYQIIATFAGSASYYSSFAQTYIQVDEAPPATAPPEYPQPIDNTWTIIGVGIAIILVVIIVAILLLRKK
jgi:outer membrane protein assembly factor BamB